MGPIALVLPADGNQREPCKWSKCLANDELRIFGFGNRFSQRAIRGGDSVEQKLEGDVVRAEEG
jgi:hypothetical protein